MLIVAVVCAAVAAVHLIARQYSAMERLQKARVRANSKSESRSRR